MKAVCLNTVQRDREIERCSNSYRCCYYRYREFQFQRQVMDAPVSLVKLPTEILEAVCSFLNIFHICNMELVSCHMSIEPTSSSGSPLTEFA